MKEYELIGAENKPIDIKTHFDILSKKLSEKIKWLCAYRKSNNEELYKKI